MRVRDYFRGAQLRLELMDAGWMLTLRAPDGHEETDTLTSRDDAVASLAVWMGVMEDDTEMSPDDWQGWEAWMRERLARIELGEPAPGDERERADA